jgi:alkylhydroperoxidase/carboxymuconolactone decarboxylase family protein YurZ
MSEEQGLISKAFEVFMNDAPGHAAAWNTLVQSLTAASALDAKTASLAYLAVLAALGLESGIPFHVRSAKSAGATREEVISAILVGLPASGHGVTRGLPGAVAAYDSD